MRNWNNCGSQIRIITTFAMLLVMTYGCGFISWSLSVSFVPGFIVEPFCIEIVAVFLSLGCAADIIFSRVAIGMILMMVLEHRQKQQAEILDI